jgi:hypothetical protein
MNKIKKEFKGFSRSFCKNIRNIREDNLLPFPLIYETQMLIFFLHHHYAFSKI